MSSKLNDCSPRTVLTDLTHDISHLCISWWMPVYFDDKDASFGSEPTEIMRHFVRISKYVGHVMSDRILMFLEFPFCFVATNLHAARFEYGQAYSTYKEFIT